MLGELADFGEQAVVCDDSSHVESVVHGFVEEFDAELLWELDAFFELVWPIVSFFEEIGHDDGDAVLEEIVGLFVLDEIFPEFEELELDAQVVRGHHKNEVLTEGF